VPAPDYIPENAETGTQNQEAMVGAAAAIDDGDFYAATVVNRFGLGPEGFIRAGCACYTTEEEIDRLLNGIDALR
jgi:selenocysteine lyase/cysteine desulfurase